MREDFGKLSASYVVQAHYDKSSLLAELADRFASGDHASEEAQANLYRLEVIEEAEAGRAVVEAHKAAEQKIFIGRIALAAAGMPLQEEPYINIGTLKNAAEVPECIDGRQGEISEPFSPNSLEKPLKSLDRSILLDQSNSDSDRW